MKLYADGALQPQKPNAADWSKSDAYNIPASTSVVGIECEDYGKY